MGQFEINKALEGSPISTPISCFFGIDFSKFGCHNPPGCFAPADVNGRLAKYVNFNVLKSMVNLGAVESSRPSQGWVVNNMKPVGKFG